MFLKNLFQHLDRFFVPAILGALIFAVLSSIPGLSYVNGFLLFWLLVACIASAHFFHKFQSTHPSHTSALYLGVLTGVFGVLLTVLFWFVLDYFALPISPMVRLYHLPLSSDLHVMKLLLLIGVVLGGLIGLVYGLFANFLHRILHKIDVAASVWSAFIVCLGILLFSLILNLFFQIAGSEPVKIMLNNFLVVIFLVLMIVGGYLFIVFYDRFSRSYLEDYRDAILFSVIISFFVLLIASLFFITDKIGWHLLSVEDFGFYLVALIAFSLLFAVPVLVGCLYGISRFRQKHVVRKKIHGAIEHKTRVKNVLHKNKVWIKNSGSKKSRSKKSKPKTFRPNPKTKPKKIR